VELTGDAVVCTREVANFKCSRNGVAFISWEVQSTCGSRNLKTGFSSSTLVGFTSNRSLCNSLLTFIVTSLTNFSICVTLTIHRPLLLNGSRITCREESTILVVSGNY